MGRYFAATTRRSPTPPSEPPAEKATVEHTGQLFSAELGGPAAVKERRSLTLRISHALSLRKSRSKSSESDASWKRGSVQSPKRSPRRSHISRAAASSLGSSAGGSSRASVDENRALSVEGSTAGVELEDTSLPPVEEEEGAPPAGRTWWGGKRTQAGRKSRASRASKAAPDPTAKPAKPDGPKIGFARKMAMKAERKVVSKAVSSDLGKRALRAYLQPEAFDVMDALRLIYDSDPSLPKDTGLRMQTIVLKLGSKVALLMQHRLLLPNQFRNIVYYGDTLSEAIVRKYDCTRTAPYYDPSDPTHEKLIETLEEVERIFIKLISPHVSDKTTAAASEVIGYITPRAVTRMLTDPTQAKQMSIIAEKLRYL
ncbi:hypothetical protein AB1Y20_019624 [Prymnesium parvum]|uniref:Uncharacterized protein n=1 Tax=Prymnesium parvum TaxID=97485 RepID=A0AB34JUW5_PRYPA